ncbi:general odorant-binding protein 56a-like [Pectinophora gossypiella]|uniref:general odorant-binding protein 56a-like n=1 Tax=Pectinophora gossypiella TaxID=13191 RepID=UPI00214E74E9|nr:general odorant-binding protein 56a-like [Pectinophora gossypiella]
MLPGILSAALLTILVKNATAITDDQRAQIQAKFLQVGAECLKDHTLSVDDISAFKNKKFPDSENAPCFTACIFKKVGIIDDDGNLSQSNTLEHAKKIFEDEEDLKTIEEFLTTCAKVNDEEVSDDDKKCARSKLAYTCLIENADKFGFNIDF